MQENFIVIGDIHGCNEQLEEIIELLKNYSDHKYVFLGDYIDRGPDPEGVLNILKTLDGIFLLGNHEEMLIERYKHASYDERNHLMMQASISVNSLNWIIEKTQIKFESENYIFVHAGINKSKKLADQNSRDYIWTREKGDYLELTSKKVIHGHTIVENPEIVGNRININTGCGSNGFLSALVLPEMKFFKSSTSPGNKNDWVKILKDLEMELKELDDFGTLEEIE